MFINCVCKVKVIYDCFNSESLKNIKILLHLLQLKLKMQCEYITKIFIFSCYISINFPFHCRQVPAVLLWQPERLVGRIQDPPPPGQVQPGEPPQPPQRIRPCVSWRERRRRGWQQRFRCRGIQRHRKENLEHVSYQKDRL